VPIKPENRKRYPSNWKQIRAAILERAGNRCERCYVRQYGVGHWKEQGFHYVRGNRFWDQFEYAGSYADAREAADEVNDWHDPETRVIVIVLTIAHLDHTPENCDPANLQALCQRCHLRHDAKLHASNSAKTRRAKKGNGELFETEAA